MKGGHPSSGPPPDPNALRRERDKGDWTRLSAGGRLGAPPEWPLTEATTRELQHWVREWLRPQALMWERLNQEVEVALYCRTLVDAERQGAPTNVRTLIRQQQEALGLSVPGLARNRWRIDDASTAAPTDRAPEDVGDRDARRRADLALVVNN